MERAQDENQNDDPQHPYNIGLDCLEEFRTTMPDELTEVRQCDRMLVNLKTLTDAADDGRIEFCPQATRIVRDLTRDTIWHVAKLKQAAIPVNKSAAAADAKSDSSSASSTPTPAPSPSPTPSPVGFVG